MREGARLQDQSCLLQRPQAWGYSRGPSVPTCRSRAQEAAPLIVLLDNNPSFIGFHHQSKSRGDCECP